MPAAAAMLLAGATASRSGRNQERMAHKSTKYKDLLDYTVSYRSVWTMIGVFFAFLVAGLIAWTELKPPGEDETARQDVKTAERLVQRADACAQQELKPDDQRLIADAKTAYEAATSALARRQYGQASTSAKDAQVRLKQFVETVCAARDAVAEFVRIQGDVKVKKAQSLRFVPARKGQLAVGDRIWAVDGVAQIQYKVTNETQEIRPGTIIEIKDVFQRSDGMSGTITSLESGTMQMQSQANSPSVINAPNDVRVEPSGDRVEVESVENSGRTSVTGYHGGARVTRGTETRVLDRDMRVEATPAGLGQPSKALASPEPKEPIDGRIYNADKTEDKLIVFSWQPMDGATGYRFQIARNDVFTPVLNAGEGERIKEPAAEIDTPPPNTYFWRVKGIDGQGLGGDWSEVRKFSVRSAVAMGDDKDHPPPTITVTKPIEFGDRVIISGSTQQYVTLEVNLNGRKYQDVPVDEKGAFQVLVTLSQEGKNTIEFVAHDTYGQETKKLVIAHFTL
jgi:hypothetical protein